MEVVMVGAGYAGALRGEPTGEEGPAGADHRGQPATRLRRAGAAARADRRDGTRRYASPGDAARRNPLAGGDRGHDRRRQRCPGTGDSLDFDRLFLTVGSTVSARPGTGPVGAWEGAENARTALAGLPAGSSVSVVGGGLTRVETAAAIAYGRSDLRVRLVGQTLLPTFSQGARGRVRAGLERLGCRCWRTQWSRCCPARVNGVPTRCDWRRTSRSTRTSSCGPSSTTFRTWPREAACRSMTADGRSSMRICAV